MVSCQPCLTLATGHADGLPPTVTLVNTPHRNTSALVGVVLGVVWLAVRPMLTGLGLGAVGLVAAVAVGWAWRATNDV
jgi:hypothetical protein